MIAGGPYSLACAAGLNGERADPVACAQGFYGAAIAKAHNGIYCTRVPSMQSSAGIAVPSLFSEICRLIDRGSYVVGEHASERLLERGIMESKRAEACIYQANE